jgi:hypothetical protein
MNNFLRTILAGYAAKKWGGGGCLGIIAVFVIAYFILGRVHC